MTRHLTFDTLVGTVIISSHYSFLGSGAGRTCKEGISSHWQVWIILGLPLCYRMVCTLCLFLLVENMLGSGTTSLVEPFSSWDFARVGICSIMFDILT